MRIVPEAKIFIDACILGAGLSILWIFIFLVRTMIGKYFWVNFAGDLLFWLLAAGATFQFSLTKCSGWLRAFVLAGELLGFILCRMTAGEWIGRLGRWLIQGIKYISLWIWKITGKPISLALMCILNKIKRFNSQLLQK